MIETLTPFLNNYFSNPLGLLALLALIPLAVFYLVKKEPEEQVMPSFMFFHDEDEMSSTQSSFRKLMRNLLLLLHVLVIIGFAAAFAQPYIPGAGTPEHSVLVIDRSASMSGDLGETKDFLRENLGNRNTVIAVDNDATLLAENVPSSEAASIIGNVRQKDTGTDIASGLERAAEYEGSVFIGSDLDQTVDGSGVEDILDRLEAEGRGYETIDLERRNSWGVVSLEPGRENTSIGVKNFESRENTITVSVNGEQRELTIRGDSVETLTVESTSGRNTVELKQDDFSEDNTAYFYIPDDRSFDITLISDEENRYLAKAFELIEFTDIEYRKPPIEGELDADMYIIGSTDRVVSDTVEEIDSQVRNGKDLVVFGHQDLQHLGFDLPVEDNGGYVNRSVSITDPVNIDLGTVEIRDVERNGGERLTTGTNAMIRSDYGSGELLFYNVKDSTFNQEFMYPVFWQGIGNEMLDRTPVEDLNYRTGQEINEERITKPSGAERSGRVELEQQGFYNTSRGTVAVNLLNRDESLRDGMEIGSAPHSETETEASVQHLVIALLLLLALAEMGYLYRIGDIR